MCTTASITAALTVGLFALVPVTSSRADGLGTLGGNVCVAANTNNVGAVVGTCRDAEGDVGAVYWAPGTVIPVPLAPLEADGPCNVYDINNANVVAGNCEFGPAGESFPTRWIATLPGSAPQRLSPIGTHAKAAAWKINHAGVVGGASIEGSGGERAVIWKAGQATPTALPELGLLPPLLPSSTECEIADMTDDANPIVVGTCALRDGGNVAVKWEPRLLGYWATELPRLEGGSNCEAVAINHYEHVAGTCENAIGDIVAVRWSANGERLTYLDYLEASGASRQQLSVVDMNEAGIVVGNYLTDEGFSRAFVWLPVDNPTLEEGLDIGGLGGFWTSVSDIADDGTFAGSAQNGQGVVEAFRGRVDREILGLGTLGGFTSRTAALSDDGAFLVGTSQTAAGFNNAFLLSAAPETDAAEAHGGRSNERGQPETKTCAEARSFCRKAVHHRQIVADAWNRTRFQLGRMDSARPPLASAEGGQKQASSAAGANDLMLLFDRPKEPLFMPKGGRDAVFDVPQGYWATRDR